MGIFLFGISLFNVLFDFLKINAKLDERLLQGIIKLQLGQTRYVSAVFVIDHSHFSILIVEAFLWLEGCCFVVAIFWVLVFEHDFHEVFVHFIIDDYFLIDGEIHCLLPLSISIR